MMEIQEPEVQSDSAQVKSEFGLWEAEVLFNYAQVRLYSTFARKIEVGKRRVFWSSSQCFFPA